MLSPVRTLSLGQRMRADLGAALLHNPKIIYLDEPTIGLDVVVKEKVREAIKKINETYGTTIILTTHDLADIEELCDRIIIIDKGIKIYDGSLVNIKEKYGYMTTVEIILKDVKDITNLDINKYFKLKNDELECKFEDGKVSITFNKNKVTSTELMGYVMSKCTVVDFKIIETSIEDIIKKIYRNEV